MSAMFVAPKAVERVVLRVHPYTGAVLRRLWHRMEHVFHAGQMSRLWAPVEVDDVSAMW